MFNNACILLCSVKFASSIKHLTLVKAEKLKCEKGSGFCTWSPHGKAYPLVLILGFDWTFMLLSLILFDKPADRQSNKERRGNINRSNSKILMGFLGLCRTKNLFFILYKKIYMHDVI